MSKDIERREISMLFSGSMVRALIDRLKSETRRVVKFAWIHEDYGIPHPYRAWIDESYLDPKFGEVPCLKVPFGSGEDETVWRYFPKWQTGDRIWVKETFFDFLKFQTAPVFHGLPGNVAYRADDTFIGCHKWTPSIFMPRWASRIDLQVLKVRCQRLQDITEAEAQAEGSECFADIDYTDGNTYRAVYRQLWNSINLKPSPVYHRVDGVRKMVGYEAYPWSESDFDSQYPGARLSKLHRGLPLRVFANPWVWVITFKRVK